MLSSTRLHVRAAFFRAIRSFFFEQEFLEVDTPVRTPLLIPESCIQPVAADGWFLQTSPEQYMKRLLAAGNDKIFQICPCFRKEERGRLHSEEFTMLEWYRTGCDYYDLMSDCQNLVLFIVNSLFSEAKDDMGTSSCPAFADTYFVNDWPRMTVAEAFRNYSPISLEKAMGTDQFDEILVEYIEPHLGFEKPTFLIDYPVSMASLARVHRNDPTVAERFELYMNGVELANGFSELTDPVEQRQRFQIELENIANQGGGQQKMPERFLQDIESIDTAAGIAMGLDRLLMILLGKKSLSEVVSFSDKDLDC